MSTTQTVSLLPASVSRAVPNVSALALPGILIAGFTLRVVLGLTQIHVLFLDETMQYFEQGHRLAFGSGVVPWEFIDGIRSWLLPGLIAIVMRISASFSDDPMVYIDLVRTLCVCLSMVVVFVGFRAGKRDSGRLGAIVTGGFCAIWFDLIYFAPAVMTEVLAAHCAVAALFLGETEHSSRKAFWAGVLFGGAVCLRYQYAPSLIFAAAWQYRSDPGLWRWMLLGASAVLLPFSGLLDAITWGAPFQSIWLNFARNARQGVSAAIGREEPRYYLDYLMIALAPLPLMASFAAVGATRFPALAIAALTTLVLHSLLPHKEVRFIYLTLAAAPILIGLGASKVLQFVSTRYTPRAATLGPAVFLVLSAFLSLFIASGPLGPRWAFQRDMVHVFLAAHREPGICGLQVRGIPSWRSGGYTYLNRDIPLMFDPYVPEVRLPGVSVPLRFMVERAGGPVPQLRSPYSHVIVDAFNPPAGFTPVVCFPEDAPPGAPPLCLFRRQDGCL